MRGWRPQVWPLIVTLLLTATLPGQLLAQGIALNGVGPVNRSMQGASTAAPIDAAGALYWNPAGISGMNYNEAVVGLELLLPTETVSSQIAGVGSGSSGGEPGVAPIPVVGWVHHIADTPWTVGLGMYGVGGYRVNYLPSAVNPITTPQPPNGFGVGRIYGELEVFQIAPTVSYAMTEHLSIGIAPTIDLAKLSATPLFLAAPDDANGDGFPSYPSGLGTRYHWGGGAQLGVYYTPTANWHFGASLKSPQWFEPFRFMTSNELGGPRLAKLNIDYPMILSLGASYTGLPNLLLACDVRYFDYKNTDGFRQAGFAADGAGLGLGWRNIVTVSTGAQYALSEHLYARVGYSYQQNPISAANTVFNVASPLIIEHLVSVGGSCYLTDNVSLDIAYIHGFEARSTGPFQSPAGPIPGTSVSSEISADGLGMGLTVRY
jgi:long-chain fatty acid transport protein